jgi:hypothetical protein
VRGEGKIKKEDIPTIIKTPFLGESALLQIPYWSDAMRTPLEIPYWSNAHASGQ